MATATGADLMGEAKRRALVDEITRRLVDEGKLIESGWQSLRIMTIREGASFEQLSDMRVAFFAGAQHLWGSMMTFLEEGQEPTEADLKRMDAIHKELEQFIEEFKLRQQRPEGQG